MLPMLDVTRLKAIVRMMPIRNQDLGRNSIPMNHIEIGKCATPDVVFGHGWGRTHHDFIPVAEAIAPFARSILLDLPGFGETPRVADNWGSVEYADHIAQFIRQKTDSKIIWVGHSFGGRIGLRLAVRHADILRGMVLIASAGVPVHKSLRTRLYASARQMQFRFLKTRAADQQALEKLEQKFGSADYIESRRTGMRDVLLNVIREDQSVDLPQITTPTKIVYGAKDTETPVEIGQKLQGLIPGSKLIVCPEFDHIGVLDRGRHQIALVLKEMLQEMSA